MFGLNSVNFSTLSIQSKILQQQRKMPQSISYIQHYKLGIKFDLLKNEKS